MTDGVSLGSGLRDDGMRARGSGRRGGLRPDRGALCVARATGRGSPSVRELQTELEPTREQVLVSVLHSRGWWTRGEEAASTDRFSATSSLPVSHSHVWSRRWASFRSTLGLPRTFPPVH